VTRERAGVDPLQAHDAVALQEALQITADAPVAGDLAELLHDAKPATCTRRDSKSSSLIP